MFHHFTYLPACLALPLSAIYCTDTVFVHVSAFHFDILELHFPSVPVLLLLSQIIVAHFVQTAAKHANAFNHIYLYYYALKAR